MKNQKAKEGNSSWAVWDISKVWEYPKDINGQRNRLGNLIQAYIWI